MLAYRICPCFGECLYLRIGGPGAFVLEIDNKRFRFSIYTLTYSCWQTNEKKSLPYFPTKIIIMRDCNRHEHAESSGWLLVFGSRRVNIQYTSKCGEYIFYSFSLLNRQSIRYSWRTIRWWVLCHNNTTNFTLSRQTIYGYCLISIISLSHECYLY